jgi:hypothetical protein
MKREKFVQRGELKKVEPAESFRDLPLKKQRDRMRANGKTERKSQSESRMTQRRPVSGRLTQRRFLVRLPTRAA